MSQMVQAITQFKTTTGKSFDTEFEAWGEELRDFLVKHGADNDAIARKIVQAVVDGQPETLCMLADIVENMHRCAPLPPPVALDTTAQAVSIASVAMLTANPRVPAGQPAPPVTDLCPKCMRVKLAGEDCTHCTLHN